MTAETGVRAAPERAAGAVSWPEVVIFVALLALAAVARLGWPGLTEFKADEARLLTAALEMSGGQFAVRGISSSVGFPNAPMSVWLYALPLAVWRHPYAATLFTGLLSVLAVAGVYWFARRYWGQRAAIAATLILAASPWAILFSRKIWAQDLLPIFAVGWAIAAALTFVEERRPFVILHLLCLGIAVQLHLAAIGLVPATLLFLIVFRRRVDWRYVLLGGALAALTAAPYLWYLWSRLQTEGGLPFTTGQSSAQISLDSLRLSLEIVSGRGLLPLAGAGYVGVPGEAAVQLLWIGIALAGVGWALFQARRQWNRPVGGAAFICLAWFLAPALLFAWHRTPVYVHYFIVVLPAACLMIGAAFDALIQASRLWARSAAWVALIALACWQLVAWGGLMSTVAGDPAAGGFGVPLGIKLAAADDARAILRETGAVEVLIAGNGSEPELEEFPAEFRALLHDTPVRYVDLNAEALFPGATSVVLLGSPSADELTSTRDLYTAAGVERATSDLNGEPIYAILSLPAAAAPAPDVALTEPALLANFVRLTGHNDLRDVAVGALWDVYWRPADNPDPADYHIFNHLIDGTGARIAQTDAAAFPGRQWRPGDVVISRFLLPLTEEPQLPLTMHVGMYRFPSLENVPLLDEAANPAADVLELPLGD